MTSADAKDTSRATSAISPTNRNLALPLAFMIDVRDGKIRKWSSYFDVASVMRQIDVQQ